MQTASSFMDHRIAAALCVAVSSASAAEDDACIADARCAVEGSDQSAAKEDRIRGQGSGFATAVAQQRFGLRSCRPDGASRRPVFQRRPTSRTRRRVSRRPSPATNRTRAAAHRGLPGSTRARPRPIRSRRHRPKPKRRRSSPKRKSVCRRNRSPEASHHDHRRLVSSRRLGGVVPPRQARGRRVPAAVGGGDHPHCPVRHVTPLQGRRTAVRGRRAARRHVRHPRGPRHGERAQRPGPLAAASSARDAGSSWRKWLSCRASARSSTAMPRTTSKRCSSRRSNCGRCSSRRWTSATASFAH